MRKSNIKIGDTLNKLTLERIYKKRVSDRNITMGVFQCSCGNETKHHAKLSRVVIGEIRSCGCLNKEACGRHITKVNKARSTHGSTPKKLYNKWKSMIERCKNKNVRNYKNYGGRGIKVCKEWEESFEIFRTWAFDNGWQEHLTIERVDVNGDYCPNNCKFITIEAQALNRRNNRRITAFGETKTLIEWVRDERCVVKRETLKERLNKDWNAEAAITTPPKTPVSLCAYGECKTISEWANDDRCQVNSKLLGQRIYEKGWSLEDALSTPKGVKRTHR